MSFKTRRLPAFLENGEVNKVLSLRGEKLTYLEDDHVYVVRSGSDPRAWRKEVDEKGNGTGPWQHCRPSCDRFLRSPAVFERMRSAWMKDFRKVRDRKVERRERLPFDITEPIWKRGRRVKPELRKLETWSKSEYDEFDENYRLAPRLRTNQILRQDIERGSDPDAYYDDPQVDPIMTTEYLLDQHYLLRRIIRLNWIIRWTAGFPPDAVSFLEDHRFSTRRWHLLNLWMRVPEGRELFIDIPQLAWLLASSWNIKRKPVQKPLRSLRSLVKKPRANLLAWLDLPGGKGTLNLLRRIKPADFSPTVAYWLREALRNDQGRSWLQNMEGRIDGKMLYLLGRDQPITFPVALAISKNQQAGPVSAKLSVNLLYFHIRKMLREFDREEDIELLGRIHSPDRLREWHDQLVAELNARPPKLRLALSTAWEKVGNIVYPPLQPTDSIQPLPSHDLLTHEGSLMHHCIATYSYDVVHGSYYAYAVLFEGERATLGLQRVNDRTWRISEVRGKCNATVSPALRKHVGQWLKEAPPFQARPVVTTQPIYQDLESDWIDESEYAGVVGVGGVSEMEPF